MRLSNFCHVVSFEELVGARGGPQQFNETVSKLLSFYYHRESWVRPPSAARLVRSELTSEYAEMYLAGQGTAKAAVRDLIRHGNAMTLPFSIIDQVVVECANGVIDPYAMGVP